MRADAAAVAACRAGSNAPEQSSGFLLSVASGGCARVATTRTLGGGAQEAGYRRLHRRNDPVRNDVAPSDQEYSSCRSMTYSIREKCCYEAPMPHGCGHFVDDVTDGGFMKRIGRIGVRLALGASLLVGAAGAQATTVISNSPFSWLTWGGSVTYADRLTAWFGKGSLTLTNIFDSQAQGRPLPAELDAAVSGKGPTFTVFEMVDPPLGQLHRVGYYNPLNGVTPFGGNAGETSYDAFLFNFTTNRVLRPIYDPSVSEDYRISNVWAGSDLYFDDIVRGKTYTFPELYADSFTNRTLLWKPEFYGQLAGPTAVSYIMLEVYSISVDSLVAAAAVPEPATWATMLVGFGLIGGVVRSSRRRTIATCA